MHGFRRVVVAWGVVLAMSPAPAATLIHEYALQGTLGDNLGGPDLVELGANLDGTELTTSGYVFGLNEGLALSSALLSTSDFSFELSFHFEDPSGYVKIADFKNLGSDSGFYALNSQLNFYPITTATSSDFVSGVDVHVVFTRDGASGLVTGYVNGMQRISFSDTSGYAVIAAPENRLSFFIDDASTGHGEASGGAVNYLRFYNGALTATEVTALYEGGPPLAIPEPSTYGLLGLGLGLVLMQARRRGRAGGGR